MKLKVTTTQMCTEGQEFKQDWDRLVAYVRERQSDLVVLPELPFFKWFMNDRSYNPPVWQSAVLEHAAWQLRFRELGPACVIATRPISHGDCRVNEGFVWSSLEGFRPAHQKYYLPDEEDVWEASWYQRGDGDFSIVNSHEARLGFLICSELWFPERARLYGQAGAQIIVNPRASGRGSIDKWLTMGRSSAMVAGAFVVSANRVSHEVERPVFGGDSWVIDPNGEVLARTSIDAPFVTVEIDLSEADQAKHTYPRYIPA